MFVCVCEREREKERKKEREREKVKSWPPLRISAAKSHMQLEGFSP